MEAFSKTVVNLNKLRSDAVEMAFKKMLFAQLRKEMIHKIRGEAIDRIKRSIQRTRYSGLLIQITF